MSCKEVVAMFGLALTSLVLSMLLATCAHAGGFDACMLRGAAKCHERYPLPSPVVTATPHALNCADGTFTFDAGAGLWTFKLTPQPGRTYHLCADVPVKSPVPVALELKTQNKSNTGCDVYAITAFAPSNYSAKPLPSSVQPGFPFKYEGGRWQLDVVLDTNPETLCNAGHGLVLFLWPW